MEVTARVFIALVIVVTGIVECLEVKSKDRLDLKLVYKYRISNGVWRKRALEGRSWSKANLSKSARKRSRRRVAYSSGLIGMDPFYTLLLSGDVELNPGPTNQLRIINPQRLMKLKIFLRFS